MTHTSLFLLTDTTPCTSRQATAVEVIMKLKICLKFCHLQTATKKNTAVSDCRPVCKNNGELGRGVSSSIKRHYVERGAEKLFLIIAGLPLCVLWLFSFAGTHHVWVHRERCDDWIGEQIALGLLAGMAVGTVLRSFLWIPLWYCWYSSRLQGDPHLKPVSWEEVEKALALKDSFCRLP